MSRELEGRPSATQVVGGLFFGGSPPASSRPYVAWGCSVPLTPLSRSWDIARDLTGARGPRGNPLRWHSSCPTAISRPEAMRRDRARDRCRRLDPTPMPFSQSWGSESYPRPAPALQPAGLPRPASSPGGGPGQVPTWTLGSPRLFRRSPPRLGDQGTMIQWPHVGVPVSSMVKVPVAASKDQFDMALPR